jgi:hypothetical protein
MAFAAPPWCRELVASIPEDRLVGEFVLEGNGIDSGQQALVVCAETGESYAASDLQTRVAFLAQSLAHLLGWSPNQGAPEDKVVGICAFNSVGTFPYLPCLPLSTGQVKTCVLCYTAAAPH